MAAYRGKANIPQGATDMESRNWHASKQATASTLLGKFRLKAVACQGGQRARLKQHDAAALKSHPLSACPRLQLLVYAFARHANHLADFSLRNRNFALRLCGSVRDEGAIDDVVRGRLDALLRFLPRLFNFKPIRFLMSWHTRTDANCCCNGFRARVSDTARQLRGRLLASEEMPLGPIPAKADIGYYA